MKKIGIFALIILCCISLKAQEKRTVRETFDNNKFRWDEFYEKTGSASIQDGYFIISNTEKGTCRWSVAELPIDIDQNFKLTFKVLVPKLTDEFYFGIVFNYEDENNYSSFLVTEKKFKILNKVNGVSAQSRASGIILKAGKNKEVVIEIEKKGTKLIFTVDNMEAIAISKELKTNTFGFLVEDANTIKIDEVIIEQISR
ncbi:MAG: hypothetical protein LBR36_02480 [Bacteroidales bacterium]|jgi:hypothetical protein|nr:hypothetical protein [Bacteroidales bacterium]